MTTDATALAKIGEWTGICGDKPEVLVEELAALGFVVARRDDVFPGLAEAAAAIAADEQTKGIGVAMAEAMMALFGASFEGGSHLIALRGSHLISPDVQVDVDRWYGVWDAKHREGMTAMARVMDLLRQAKDPA